MEKDLKISLLLDYYGELLSEKQRRLVDAYYNGDLSLSEISENEGMTRQGVRDGIKRAELQLYDADNKLGLVEKGRELSKLADKIISAADLIDSEDEKIKKAVRSIVSAASKITI